METEGSLYQSVLDLVPKERIEDVVLFDLAEVQVGRVVLDVAADERAVGQHRQLRLTGGAEGAPARTEPSPRASKAGSMAVWVQ